MAVFTPLNESRTERLRIDSSKIELLEGNLMQRVIGLKATIRVEGKTYEVHGINCGLRNCDCDAYIKEIA